MHEADGGPGIVLCTDPVDGGLRSPPVPRMGYEIREPPRDYTSSRYTISVESDRLGPSFRIRV